MNICKDCNVELKLNINWNEWDAAHQIYICKHCRTTRRRIRAKITHVGEGKWAYKNYQKGYWERNPEKYEKVKAKMRERSKQYRLGKKEAHV